MYRLSGALLRRIGYLTDVEGDFSYFQRFVCISRVLRWEELPGPAEPSSRVRTDCNGRERNEGQQNLETSLPWAPLQSPVVKKRTETPTASAPPTPPSPSETKSLPHPSLASGITVTSSAHQAPPERTAAASSPQALYEASYCHLIDTSRYRLSFADATSHFVFGGDAFDHGADLTFGRVLLDLKRRFPQRVHLLLGNRDVNKMVLYPRMAREVTGMTADEAEDAMFALPPLTKAMAKTALLTPQLRYRDYLLRRQRQDSSCTRRQSEKNTSVEENGKLSSAASTRGDPVSCDAPPVMADPVTFLQWTLTHKLGSPNAFEHRRHELQELQALHLASQHGTCGTAQRHPITDQEVADSFFAAAQPGGVYYDYIQHGVLSVVLDGVLFVHGGVNGRNAGFVPSLTATHYAEQVTAGEWWLPEVQPVVEDEGVAEREQDRTAAVVDGGHRKENRTAQSSLAAATPSSKQNAAAAPTRKSALEWLNALAAFKDAAFHEWVTNTGLCGEALRAYVYPRVVAPHSIAVGTVMDLDGPHHISLPAAMYLMESGIHTVCGGHQPVGDTPAVVRQPGGFVIVDADNSYCGRENAFSTRFNRRGAAVMELVFDSEDVADDSVASSLIVHGYRADGAPYQFDLYADLRVGRYVGDGWWVRLPPCVASNPHAGLYELRRTTDGFRHEEVRYATGEEVDARLQHIAASGQARIEGDLAARYTKEELAEVHVHRIKTKVKRATQKNTA